MKKIFLILAAAIFAGGFSVSAYERQRPYPPRGFRRGGNGARNPRSGGGPASAPPKELVNDTNLRRETFSSPNGKVNYCEFLENPDVAGALSLVLVLHGMADRGSDNLQQLASPAVQPLLKFVRQRKIKALILIPQCPADRDWARGEKSLIGVLNDLVAAQRKRYAISAERSIITGFSMGGGACYLFMMSHPGVFKRALVVSTGGINSWASKLSGGEFYIAVGSDDQVISVSNAEALARELVKRNQVRFEKLPGLDHTATAAKVYSGNCWNWAFGLE